MCVGGSAGSGAEKAPRSPRFAPAAGRGRTGRARTDQPSRQGVTALMLLEPERDDFWRVRSAASSAVPFKEWQHFVVLAPGVDLLINFSLGGRPRSEERRVGK